MSLFLNMASPQKVVLLACGSFNPPTNMHLRMFEIARDHLQRGGKYNVIAGIMSPVSDGYSKKDLAPAKYRIAMVQTALKSSKWIRCDTWESEQPQWLETEKVLSHHRTQLLNQYNTNVKATPSKKRRKDKKNEDVLDRGHPASRDDPDQIQLKLLCGGDLLESFAKPGLWLDEDIESIVKTYGLICITRGGSNPRQFIYESDVLTKYQDNIHIVTEWIQNEISSTKIRRALRRSESVKYLLQDSVIDYIREHQLYGTVCDNKYSDIATPSPQNDAMDFVDGDNSNELIIINTEPRSPLIILDKIEFPRSPLKVESPRSPLKISAKSDEPDSGNHRSPRHHDVIVHRKLSKETGSAPGSPRRFLDEDVDGDSSNSPKSPQPGPCMTDLTSIVRRVKNYNLQGIFHPKKIQPK